MTSQDIVKVNSLLDYPVSSYQRFLIDKSNIRDIFKSVFPVICNSRNINLDYIDHEIEFPKEDKNVYKLRGANYAARLIVKFGLKQIDDQGKEHYTEKSIYVASIPVITQQGSFIINGHEKVLISQIQKSPGIFFHRGSKKDLNKDHSVTIIPQSGSWFSVILDSKNDFFIKIDKRKKITLAFMLDSIGFTPDTVFNKLIKKINCKIYNDKIFLLNIKDFDICPVDLYCNDILIAKKGSKISSKIKQLDSLYTNYNDIIGMFCLENDYDYKVISQPNLQDLLDQKEFFILFSNYDLKSIFYLLKYYSLHSNNPLYQPFSQDFSKYIHEHCFNPSKYDLSSAGRKKINIRLGNNVSSNILTQEDILLSSIYLIHSLSLDKASDDLDDFRNKKIKSLTDMIRQAIKLGVLKMYRSSYDAISYSRSNITVSSIINTSPMFLAIKSLFLKGGLIQFMDQTNALSALSHVRRLSSLGSSGLSKERSGLEARDIHHTHYGRLCAVETPEGQSCGLVSSLGTFAHIDKHGFIELPYVKVNKGKVLTNKIDMLNTDQEFDLKIAGYTQFCPNTKKILFPNVYVRYKGDIIQVNADQVEYMDVSTKQMIGVAASLIPFLSHNDAKRSLMGANMQRQALPLINPQSPDIRTGMESYVARYSGLSVIAKRDGKIDQVNSKFITVVTQKGSRDVYFLTKYQKTNQKTCINQKPLVNFGDQVKKGDMLADGFSIKNKCLALGRNVRVAFLPFYGYNFEDAIVVSEDLLKDDAFTSIQIEEFICSARDTKLGQEEITSDIPNLSHSDLQQLDERGIIKIGTQVKPGDVLVGKITPKAEEKLSSEEKLLYAIFGKKALDVKDTSLRVPHNIYGTVIDVHIISDSQDSKLQTKEIELDSFVNDDIFDQKIDIDNVNKNLFVSHDDNDTNLLSPGTSKIVKVIIARKMILQAGDKLSGRHGNKGVVSAILPKHDMPYDSDGRPVDMVLNPLGVTPRMNIGQLHELQIGGICAKAQEIIQDYLINNRYVKLKNFIKKFFDQEDLTIDLQTCSKQQILDFAQDQVKFGVKKTIPSFCSISKDQMDRLSALCNIPNTGKIKMFDGFTGEAYKYDVSVGNMYIMKLNHLVEDKIHARSTGSYGLITQQPLGGKAQQGGQRLGEMEASAIQAYGAAYTLQEMITVKSDDIIGRNMLYTNIVKNNLVLKSFVPESFSVLQKELAALAISLDCIYQTDKKDKKQTRQKKQKDAKKDK